MNDDEALERLRDAVPRTALYVAATGAGAGIQDRLWSIPGASAFLIGASFPYACAQTDEFLGYRPARYCSEEAALELAMAAFIRACEAATPTHRPVGLGLTASVASLREHRGDHRIHVAVITLDGATVASEHVAKGTGAIKRASDGRQADALGLRLLLDSDRGTVMDEDRLRALFLQRPLFRASGVRESPESIEPDRSIFLAGTFNPLHDGHRGMARAVARLVPGSRVIYSITASPVHKPRLGTIDMLRLVAHLRADRWRGEERDFVFSDGEPLYLDKARRYPGAAFAIGVDAVLRMLDPKWGPEVRSMLAELRRLGTKFYVFGREVEGRYVGPLDFDAHGYDELFVPMRGRWEISSTRLRDATKGAMP